MSWNLVRWTFVEEKSFGDCIWWIGFLGNLGWSLSCLGEVLRWCVLVICNGGRPGGGAGGLLDLGCWSRRETPRPISEGRPHRPKLVLQRPVPATFFIADGYWDLRQGPTTFFINATVWNAIFKRYQSSPFILRHQWDRDLRDPKKSSTQELPTETLWRRLRSLPENTPNPNPYLQSSIKTQAKTRQGTVNKKTLNLALERDFTKTCARNYPSLN